VNLNTTTRCAHPEKGDVKAIENVQKRATKLYISLKISYRPIDLYFIWVYPHSIVQKITW